MYAEAVVVSEAKELAKAQNSLTMEGKPDRGQPERLNPTQNTPGNWVKLGVEEGIPREERTIWLSSVNRSALKTCMPVTLCELKGLYCGMYEYTNAYLHAITIGEKQRPWLWNRTGKSMREGLGEERKGKDALIKL